MQMNKIVAAPQLRPCMRVDVLLKRALEYLATVKTIRKLLDNVF